MSERIHGFLPQGESFRRAIRWISIRREQGESDMRKLVNEASFQFDLSPKEEMALFHWLAPGEPEK